MTHLTRTIAAVVASLALTLTAVPAHATNHTDVTLIVTELPAQVRLVPGEAIELVQDTNRTTGYTWSTKVRGDKKAIKVSKGDYTAPTTDLIGAPGITTWKITAEQPGRAVVRVLATPPGGGDPTVSKVTVIVMNP